MIRFLFLCIVFLLLYVGFNAINEFDSIVALKIFGYEIETTTFAFVALLLSVYLVMAVLFKIIFTIFDIPHFAQQAWHRWRVRKNNEQMLQVVAELILGNKAKALSLANKIWLNSPPEKRIFINLLRAECEANVPLKAEYLHNLLEQKAYIPYSAKKLAEICLNNNNLKEAEAYAIKAWNENNTDTALILLLIRIYASQSSWSKMAYGISKLQRADIKLFNKYTEEIAGYYYAAAKSALEAGNDNESIKFLESALVLKPDYLDAIHLYTELGINLKDSSAPLLKVLKNAFINSPSFEIALLYAKCVSSSVDVIYGTLASLAKPADNQGLFLAIAAYLGLTDKIAELKELKPIISDVAE